MNTSASVSLSASTAAATSTTSIFVSGMTCWQVGQMVGLDCAVVGVLVHRRASAVAVAAGDGGFEQEVVDLGMALGVPDVVAPDVRAVVARRGPRATGVKRGSANTVVELVDELALARRVADDRHEVDVACWSTPGMPLSISRSRIGDVVGAGVDGQVAGQHGGQRVRVDDAPGASLNDGSGRRSSCTRSGAGRRVSGGRTTCPSVGSTVKNSSGWTRSLWTPVGARSRPPSSAGPQMPPPVPDTQPRPWNWTQEVDQEVAGRALIGHRSMIRARDRGTMPG